MTSQHLFVAGDPGLNPLLLLHGTGGTEKDLLPIGRFLAPGAPLLSIRAPLIENGKTRYFRHTASGGFDLNDLNQQTDWLLREITTLSHQYVLAPTNLIVVGYSNGANIAARAMLERVVPFTTGIYFHAMSLGPLAAPKTRPNTTIWASHGSHDPLVGPANFAALMAEFREAGAEVTIFRHDQYHNLTKDELESAKNWLQQSGRLKEDER